MIELERHIEILLLSNDCIIVPGLGGFMAHHVPACYDKEEGLFLPPLRTLGFNPQLQLNDHLLAQSYIEAYDISYPEALHRIEEEVEELRQHLETKGRYELNDIGVLSLNEEGNLEFEPCEAGILTPELYGLNSFEMPCIEGASNPVVAVANTLATENQQEIKQEPEHETITIKMSWLRNAVAVAAAVLAFFLIGNPVANSNMDVQQSSILPITAKSEANKPAATTQPAQTSTVETVSQESPAPASQPEEQQEAKVEYVIVLASLTKASNAENYVGELQKQGFSSARSLAMSGSKLVRVVYGSYASDSEAHNSLRQLRKSSSTFADAWVLNISK